MTSKRLPVLAALASALAAIGAMAAGYRVPASGQGHTLLHLKCPPGSHGSPRYAGVGQRLQAARDDARAARSLNDTALIDRTLSDRTLSDRAMTAR